MPNQSTDRATPGATPGTTSAQSTAPPSHAESPTFQRVGILFHPKKPESIELAGAIGDFLRARGMQEIWFESAWEGEAVLTHLPHVDLLITLGGDGTLLRAARLGAAHDVPMLGVKMGRLGFLAEVLPDDWQTPLARVLDGDYWVEKRLMVRARVERPSQPPDADADWHTSTATAAWHHSENTGSHGDGAGTQPNAAGPVAEISSESQLASAPESAPAQAPAYNIVGEYDALNDVVLSRGALARIVRIRVKLDGGYLTTYTCDGLIVSTATGSTGYALAVHGPILPPELRNILVMPIAPHLSMDRAIVLSEGAEVRMKAFSDHEAMLTVDGQFVVEIHNGDEVVVVGSPHLARFIRVREHNYFYQALMDKLRWQG
ncbi:MAG: NAD(+)/NADH kinase [Litorilinea sp.]